jgi:hypothetical protein
MAAAKRVGAERVDSDPRDERHEQASTLDRHAQWIILVEAKHTRSAGGRRM